jgi:DNA-binding XRE family transcriptional regulator
LSREIHVQAAAIRRFFAVMNQPATHDGRPSDALVGKFLKLVGLFLNEKRNALGMSQDDVALAAGVSRSEVHHVEHGTTNEGLGTLFRICEAVHASLGEAVDHALYILAHPQFEPPVWTLKSQRGKNTRRRLQ